MRVIGAAILASTLVISSAFAADSSLLAPGKPAGVHKAQMEGSGLMWGLGLAVIAGGAALVASGNGKSTVTATTTTSP